MSEDSIKTMDEEKLGQTIGKAVAEGIAATQRRKITIGEYQQRRQTPWQKKASAALKLKRDSYQNGYQIPAGKLTNREIEHLNRIHRPGRYLDRRVEVVIRNQGSDSEELELRYMNRTPDQRFENKNHWLNLEDMVVKIVAEQDGIEAEEKRLREAVNRVLAGDDAKAAPKREAFSTAATREARERASA